MTSSSGAATSSSSTTLRSRSLSSNQNMSREKTSEINNDETGEQQRDNKKLRHRLKSKMLLLFPIVLLAVSCIIALSMGQIVSDQDQELHLR